MLYIAYTMIVTTSRRLSLLKFFCLFILILVLSSCIPKKKITYLREEKRAEKQDTYKSVRPEKTIQPFDNIYIKIISTDDKTSKVFSSGGGGGNTSDINLISYSVDEKGNINFPFIGEISVKDMTLNQVQDTIQREVSQYFTNVSIEVKFVNNTISVLGEVNNPGVYSFYKDQITIFQAISYAGGVTDFGNLSRVILIREENNLVNYHYLDLTTKDIVASNFFYIIPNDIIVINPIRAKIRRLKGFDYSTMLYTLTTIITFYLLLK